jgi:hypothetical protein
MNERLGKVDRILRRRLEAADGENAGEHPDANQISALTEGGLPRNERAALLAHLAGCAGCREVLALTASEPARATRRFLGWARIGSVVAAAAACVIAVWLSRPRQSAAVVDVSAARPGVPLNTVARNTVPLTPAISWPPPAPLPPAVRKSKARRLPAAGAASSSLAEVPVPAALPEIAPAEKPAANAPAPAQPAPLPADLGSLKPFQTKTKAARLFQAEQAQNPQADNGAVGGAQFAANHFTARTDVDQMGYEAHPTSAIWSISVPRNQIERSVDNGKTWEPVRIADQVSFRAVAASGTYIWAGGSDGVLFHSADNGSHWERIAIADGLTKLSGAIVSIDAPTPDRVRVTTITGERWVTSDSGRHWTKTT